MIERMHDWKGKKTGEKGIEEEENGMIKENSKWEYMEDKVEELRGL